MVFGKVPAPVITDRYIDKPIGMGWEDTGPRNIVGVCVHRMVGYLEGSDTYFRDPESPAYARALTDFGIGGKLEPSLDGAIWQWNYLEGNRRPFANGRGPKEDPELVTEDHGREFYKVWEPKGYDLNRDLASIELSGCADGAVNCGGVETDVTPVQLEALCQLIAYICDSYCKIPYQDFPYNPNVGPDFYAVYQHYEFAGKDCPYPKLKGLHGTYVARVKEILKHYQTGKTGPVPVGTGLPTTGQPGTPSTGQPAVFKVNDKIKVSVPGPINLRSEPSTSSGAITTLANGTVLCVTGPPLVNQGYKWYAVKVLSSGTTGYVAGELCTMDTKNGCGAGTAPGEFAVADRIRIDNGPAKVTAAPGNAAAVLNPPQMRPTDAIVAATRGLPEKPIAYARRLAAQRLDEVIAYVNEAYRVGRSVGFDAAIIVAQSAHETDGWRSSWWRDNLNPAGLGITGDENQEANSPVFTSGAAAARAQLAHMWAEVHGTKPLPAELVNADPTYQRVIDSGWAGEVKTIRDLTGRWATDPVYHDSLCRRGNEVFGDGLGAPTTPPSTGNVVVATLRNGTEACVVEGPRPADGYDWYRIDVEGVKGWVAGEYCAMVRSGGCADDGGSTDGGTVGRFQVNDRIQVIDGPLNLRSSASTSAAIIGSYDPGVELCVTGGPTQAGGYEWYRVPNGWVAGEFCGVVRRGGCVAGVGGEFQIDDRIVVVDGPINVRSSPTTDAAVVGSKDPGVELCVTDGPTYANGFEWYQIAGGWIAGDFCAMVKRGGCGAPSAVGRFDPEDRIYVADGPVNVRTAPSVTAALRGEFADGAEACVVEGPVPAGGFEWYRVRGAGLEGWVAGEFWGIIAFGGCRTTVSEGRFNPGDTIEIFDGPANVRSAPSLTASIVITYETWTDMCVLEGPSYNDGHDWYRVDRFGTRGWIAGVNCGLLAAGGCGFSATSLATPVASVGRSGVTTGDLLVVPDDLDDPVNLRSAPSLTATVVAALPVGTLAVVVGAPSTADGHVWQQVVTRLGRGWVAAAFLAKKANPTNLLANPTADTDLTYIAALTTGSTRSRALVDGNYAVKCVNSGSAAGQGLRYQGDAVNLAGQRRFVGVVDVHGVGVIDAAVVRAQQYAAGTIVPVFSSAAPSVTLSSKARQRVVTPMIATDATKSVNRVDLLVRRSAAAAQTFYADNAKIFEI